MTAATPCRLAALLLFLCVAAAQTQTQKDLDKKAEEKKAAEQIARLENFLEEIMIETKPFQEYMPLVKFLEVLEKQLPKDKKVSFRIDVKAFGKEFAEVAKTPIRLPPLPKKMSLLMVLRISISKIFPTPEDDPPDYRVLPTHVAITTLKHTVSTKTYDVGDLLQQTKLLRTAYQQYLHSSGTANGTLPIPGSANDGGLC